MLFERNVWGAKKHHSDRSSFTMAERSHWR